MENKLVIKKAIDFDCEVLQGISKSTFIETYEWYNTPENMELYLASNFSLNKLRHELASKDIFYFLAFYNNECIGYLKLNSNDEQHLLPEKNHIEIERIYIKSIFQRNNLGFQLLEFTKEFALSLNKSGICLGVWEKNHKAYQFYLKNGFKQVGEHTFVLGDDKQLDYVLLLEL